MADNFVRNVVQWVTDTASISKSVSEANRFGTATTAAAKRTADEFTNARAITAQYDDVLGRLGATASANLTLLEQSMRDATADTERLRQTTDRAGEEYDDLARSADRAASSASRVTTAGASGGSARSRLEDVDRFGTFGSQVAGAFGGSDLGNAIGLLGDVGDGISKLGVAGIAGTAALAGITLAQQEYTRIVNIGRTALEGALNAQTVYYTAIESLTSQQAGEDIAARQQQSVLLRERIATLESAIDRTFQQAQEQFGDGLARALEAGGQLPTAQLREQLTELQTELTANEQAAGLLEQGLVDLRFATNDAAAAAEEMSGLYQQLDQVTLTRVAAELAADRQTADQRLQRVTDIQQEIDAYQRLIDNGEVSAATIEDLEAKIGGLRVEQEAYSNTVKSTADALAIATQKQEALEEAAKSAADALTERNDQYIDAVNRQVDALTKVSQIQTQINETAAERDARLLELQGDFYDRSEELTSEANERSIEATAVAEERRQKIIRDAGLSFAEAIGTRDANAYRQANLRAKDALEDNQATVEKQQEAVVKGLEKQLAALDKGYDKQVQSTVAAANRQIIAQQASLRQQLDLADQARASQVFLAASTASSVVGYHNKMYTDMSTAAFIGGQNTVQSFMNGVNSALGGRAGGGPNYQTAPTLTSTLGPGGQAQFNKMFDQRYVQVKTAARGGRQVIIP